MTENERPAHQAGRSHQSVPDRRSRDARPVGHPNRNRPGASTSPSPVPRAAASRRCCRFSACSTRRPKVTYQLNGRPVAELRGSERARVRNREIGFIFQSFNLIGDLTGVRERRAAAHLSRHAGRRAQAARHGGARTGRHGASRRSTCPASCRAVSSSAWPWRGRSPASRSILLADEPTGNLDSKSGEAVMDLLRELHQSGATICMVTHDPRYARHADRSIHLFDGRVVEEPMEFWQLSSDP